MPQVSPSAIFSLSPPQRDVKCWKTRHYQRTDQLFLAAYSLHQNMSALNQSVKQQATRVPKPRATCSQDHRAVLHEGQFNVVLHTSGLFQRIPSLGLGADRINAPNHSLILLIHLIEACVGEWQSRLSLQSTLVLMVTPVPLHPEWLHIQCVQCTACTCVQELSL